MGMEDASGYSYGKELRKYSINQLINQSIIIHLETVITQRSHRNKHLSRKTSQNCQADQERIGTWWSRIFRTFGSFNDSQSQSLYSSDFTDGSHRDEVSQKYCILRNLSKRTSRLLLFENNKQTFVQQYVAHILVNGATVCDTPAYRHATHANTDRQTDTISTQY